MAAFFRWIMRKVQTVKYEIRQRDPLIPLVSTLRITAKFQELSGAPTKPQLGKRRVVSVVG